MGSPSAFPAEPALPSYITPAGYRRIVDEYERLLKVERPMVTAEVSYAASLGDRSENAEYIYGKKRLRAIDKRLRYLKGRLDRIEVVDPTTISGAVIRFSATVTLEDEDGGERVLRIVGEDEVDARHGFISYKSPIGRALIGREEGDEVSVQTPGGVRDYVIVEVAYVPLALPETS
ncbi:MAG: transcription elongation factor GreB [Alphaproteobacteria bacterium]|nr:transcription elongation factor GreB [Alphaproteobacteria bacterium]MCB9794322.1 transcription elongation factor GreB [Alphaproteobacteria bacterium]